MAVVILRYSAGEGGGGVLGLGLRLNLQINTGAVGVMALIISV